jgi:hypothetical protein
LFLYACLFIGLDQLIKNTLYNLSFLFLQGVLLVSYFVVKHRGWVNITDQYLGWGDVLFLLAMLPIFSLPVFILFYLSSLIITVLFVVMLQLVYKRILFIPLAGIQSLCLVAALFYHQFVTPFCFSENSLWLIN